MSSPSIKRSEYRAERLTTHESAEKNYFKISAPSASSAVNPQWKTKKIESR